MTTDPSSKTPAAASVDEFDLDVRLAATDAGAVAGDPDPGPERGPGHSITPDDPCSTFMSQCADCRSEGGDPCATHEQCETRHNCFTRGGDTCDNCA